jgi:hypothetical protein
MVWLFVFATLVRLRVGHWPGYGNPDTGTWSWPWQVLDFTVLALLFAAPVAVLVAFAAGIHSWYTRRWDWRLLLVAASFALFVAWIRIDPGGMLEWWID